ncbi:HTH-type transcriptional activator TipA [Corynebacterium ciconiae DSM 44920]|uniref:MerR family transcriptional regulator n=1 Tax=Corynebacterium ciconiae TaxID=227319 RepID=UPI0003677AB7|nr:MerR family transcriptional regulator [Corynebacterium ciconiae]WKD60595.1 HTH-type transcriptional activator TipA [Corynebacterium ciconiae DSM 44920]
MNEFTVGDVAEILGVSTRTLRYWDHIGLLCPTQRTWADHRLYTLDDVQRGMAVLILRSTGMSLQAVADIMDDPSAIRSSLRAQRRHLAADAAQLRARVRAVDNLLNYLSEEDSMSHSQSDPTTRLAQDAAAWKHEWERHHDEAEQRWSHTPDWSASQDAAEQMDEAGWAHMKKSMDSFVKDLVAAAEAAVSPSSPEAAALVERHAELIGHYYECTLAKQVLLTRMYEADERFASYYRGAAPFLRLCVEHQATQQGIDLDSVEWS